MSPLGMIFAPGAYAELVLRLQMEAYRMLQDMDAYHRAQTLLHHLNCHLVKEKGSRAQIEKRLWDRRTLFVIF